MKTIGNIFKKKFEKNKVDDTFVRNKFQSSTTKSSEVFDFLDLTHRWAEIIGKNLAKVTAPLKIQHKTLYILTAHPAFSQQLSLMENEIKNKVLSFFPILAKNFKKIHFQTNPTYFKDNSKTTREELNPTEYTKKNKLNKFSPTYRALKKEADQLFEHVDDPELLHSMISIYIQSKINNDQDSK